MSENIQLFIHKSGTESCLAKCVHRSGQELRAISCNDVVYGTDNETLCGVVISVDAERIDKYNYVYRVTYVPALGSIQPIGSYVVWRKPPNPGDPVPQAVKQRMQPDTLSKGVATPGPVQGFVYKQVAPKVNGRKRNKKQSVNGQQGSAAQASAASTTATV